MPLAAFAAGAAVALLALRLLLAVINVIAHKRRQRVRTLVVLGSGGHTAEMMALLQGFDLSVYQPRVYVVAATDAMSGQKAAAFEAAAAAASQHKPDEEAPLSASKSRTPAKSSNSSSSAQPQGTASLRRSPRVAADDKHKNAAAAAAKSAPHGSSRKALPGLRSPDSPAKRRQGAGGAPSGRQQRQYSEQQLQYSVAVIPRSREVGQSWLSSVPSTVHALWAAAAVVLDHHPDLVLLNGPGTCIPIAVAAFLGRLLGICRGRVVYVESIARVYRLSLSGKILYHSRLASPFFVQWEELRSRYPRAVYAGRLM